MDKATVLKANAPSAEQQKKDHNEKNETEGPRHMHAMARKPVRSRICMLPPMLHQPEFSEDLATILRVGLPCPAFEREAPRSGKLYDPGAVGHLHHSDANPERGKKADSGVPPAPERVYWLASSTTRDREITA